MLVSENRRRSSPRVLYGILARSALSGISDHTAPEREVSAYFSNFIRLLEMYRFNTLRRTSPRAVLDRKQIDVQSLKRDRADNEAVESALNSAHDAVYTGVQRDELVRRLKMLFEQILQGDASRVRARDLQKARAFLEHFASALKKQ